MPRPPCIADESDHPEVRHRDAHSGPADVHGDQAYESCGKHGIWIGCKDAGRLKRGRDAHGEIRSFRTIAYALCMHLRA